MNLNGAERQVYEYLDTFSLYKLYIALDGSLGSEFEGDGLLPPFEMRFGCLQDVADPDVYNEGLQLVKEKNLFSYFYEDKVRDIFRWAVDRASFKRLHMYGHCDGVTLWEYLLENRLSDISHMTDEEIEADSYLSKFRHCESLHLDLICVNNDYFGYEMGNSLGYNDGVRERSSVRHFNDLAMRGNLRNLKSLMVPCDQFQFLYIKN